MISFLEAAQHYASLGWRVFPVKPRYKGPIVNGGFKVATVSQAQIMRWWSRWPDANVGIATGLASGLPVIDLDSPCAREAWTRIYRERANGTPFPAAAVVVTARGFHIYLALDQATRSHAVPGRAMRRASTCAGTAATCSRHHRSTHPVTCTAGTLHCSTGVATPRCFQPRVEQ